MDQNYNIHAVYLTLSRRCNNTLNHRAAPGMINKCSKVAGRPQGGLGFELLASASTNSKNRSRTGWSDATFCHCASFITSKAYNDLCDSAPVAECRNRKLKAATVWRTRHSWNSQKKQRLAGDCRYWLRWQAIKKQYCNCWSEKTDNS
jgi:hypothetical protein